jgi:hypothetical protein
VYSDSAKAKNTNTTLPRIGPKKNSTPPMNAASSTPPETRACTAPLPTLSRLIADSPPETPAKNPTSIIMIQRTRCAS